MPYLAFSTSFQDGPAETSARFYNPAVIQGGRSPP